MSISPTFYEQLFHTKVLCSAFMCLQFGFVIFWQKDFGAKAAHKMLVKLTPGELKTLVANNRHTGQTLGASVTKKKMFYSRDSMPSLTRRCHKLLNCNLANYLWFHPLDLPWLSIQQVLMLKPTGISITCWLNAI